MARIRSSLQFLSVRIPEFEMRSWFEADEVKDPSIQGSCFLLVWHQAAGYPPNHERDSPRRGSSSRRAGWRPMSPWLASWRCCSTGFCALECTMSNRGSNAMKSKSWKPKRGFCASSPKNRDLLLCHQTQINHRFMRRKKPPKILGNLWSCFDLVRLPVVLSTQ